MCAAGLTKRKHVRLKTRGGERETTQANRQGPALWVYVAVLFTHQRKTVQCWGGDGRLPLMLGCFKGYCRGGGL